MKNIYISPYYLHKDILNILRKEDTFFDAKIISKEDLISQLYGKIDKKYILKIMKEYNLTYQNTKEIFSYIPYVNNSSTPHLKFVSEIKENVEIIKNVYIDQFFKGTNITVIGYSKYDKELTNALNLIGAPFAFENKSKVLGKNIIVFENIEDEVFGILNEIADLIYKGEDINNIFVYTKNETYLYYIEKYAKSFGFAVNLKEKQSFISLESSKLFIKLIKENESLSSAYLHVSELFPEDENVDKLKAYVSEEIDNLPLSLKLDFLTSEFKKITLPVNKYTNALNVIDNPPYKENSHIFILGFNQGSIPSSFKDNSFLNDKEKELIGMNSTNDIFLIEEDLLTKLLFSNNQIHISRSNYIKGEKLFPSYFVLKYCFTSEKYEFPKTIYSREMIEYYGAKYKDLFKFYKETSPEYFGLKTLTKVPYFTYNNEFTGVNAIKENQIISYSYSSAKIYNECPFKYYLSKCLKLDPFETSFSLKIGNLAHHIFEKQFEENFSFDEEWDKAVQNEEFEPKDKILLINLKKQIKSASEASVLHYKNYVGTNPSENDYKNELSLKVQLDEHSFIVGKIDKVIFIKGQYLFVIDYKTGSETFNRSELCWGESMQLPTYAYLLANSEEYKEYKLIGLYINNVIDKSFKDSIETGSLIFKHLKLKGVTINDVNLASLIDSSLRNGSSSFINNINLKSGNDFKGGSAVASSEEIEGFVNTAHDFFESINSSIRKNIFYIEPKVFNSNKSACKYCTYKDICYVKESQKLYLTPEAKKVQE